MGLGKLIELMERGCTLGHLGINMKEIGRTHSSMGSVQIGLKMEINILVSIGLENHMEGANMCGRMELYMKGSL